MSYTKHNFETGDILYASQLNEMDDQIAANEEAIENSVSSDMLAEDYSANKTYSIGDYVIYNNELYTCIYEITAPEGWNSSHWSIANLGDGISELNRQISDVEENQIPKLKSALDDIEDALVVETGKNLYNPSTIIDGAWITSTGELINQPDYGGYVTAVIPVDSGKTLYVSKNNNGVRDAATFTKARTLSSDGTTVVRVISSASTVAIESGESFVQFLFGNAQKSTELQIEYDGITPYEPYAASFAKVATKASVDDIASPINEYFPFTESINLIDPTKWQDGKWINTDGTIVSNDYGGTVIVVAVEPGKQLYLTYNDNATSILSTIRYATYDSSGNTVAVSSGSINGLLVADNVATIAICIGLVSKQTHLCLTYDRAYGYIPYTETERKVDAEKILNPVLNTVGIFNSIGAIGDSYTIASAKNSDGTWSNCQNQAYVAVLGKRSNVAYSNFGVSGANTRTYQTTSGGLSAVLAAPANDFYFLALGINDVQLGASYIGSVADINDADYTQNADTFCGNYGKIIAQVKAHAPKAKFCMVKLALRPNTTADDYCDAVEAIANHYGFPIIDQMDDPYFFSAVWGTKKDSHPTPMGYVGMALAYERLLSKAIMGNADYFKFSTIG